MKTVVLFFLLVMACLMSACSTGNSRFSCNATAGDSCLSMDDVNAMTEGKPIRVIRKTQTKRPVLLKTKIQRVWIAPFVDNQGVKHPGEVVYVPELSNEDSASV